MRFARAALWWFVDDEDLSYSPWRGVMLWVLVVALLIGVGVVLAHFGASDPSDRCTSYGSAAGDC